MIRKFSEWTTCCDRNFLVCRTYTVPRTFCFCQLHRQLKNIWQSTRTNDQSYSFRDKNAKVTILTTNDPSITHFDCVLLLRPKKNKLQCIGCSARVFEESNRYLWMRLFPPKSTCQQETISETRMIHRYDASLVNVVVALATGLSYKIVMRHTFN